jgi:hypothetical protein
MKNLAKGLVIFMVTLRAHSFVGFGTETAVLIELVTTTASQLNELEKLVSNSERFTERMQEYNLLMQDEYFRAQRVLYVAERVAAKKNVQDLGTLNWAIRNLKYNMEELNRLMAEYAKIRGDEKVVHQQVKIQKNLNQKRSEQASSQIEKSVHAPTQARANQLTAQNTALILEAQVDSHNTQLEILERVSTTNRLLAEQLEEKRIEQIQKEKAFGVNQGESK